MRCGLHMLRLAMPFLLGIRMHIKLHQLSISSVQLGTLFLASVLRIPPPREAFPVRLLQDIDQDRQSRGNGCIRKCAAHFALRVKLIYGIRCAVIKENEMFVHTDGLDLPLALLDARPLQTGKGRHGLLVMADMDTCGPVCALPSSRFKSN